MTVGLPAAPRPSAEATPADIAACMQSSPVLSSNGHGWRDVVVYRYRLASFVTGLPPARDDRLGLHLAGRALFENVSECHRIRRWSDGGYASIEPAGVPVNRSIQGRSETMQVHNAPGMLDGVAEEAFGRDSAHVSLSTCLATHDEILNRLGRLLLAEAEASALGGRLMADLLVRALAVHLLRRYSSLAPQAAAAASAPAAMAGWRLRWVVEHMHANPTEDLPLTQLAAVGGLSPSQFARAFRTATGEPPHRYLVRLRIERACDLLERTMLPVIEVGLRCGFEQPNPFATMFRKLMGLSPRAYRAARCT